MSDLTPARRAEMQRLVEAATEGPWRVDAHNGIQVWGPLGDTGSMQVAKVGYAGFDLQNAAFIAAARTMVPELLAALNEKDTEMARLTGERDEAVKLSHCECAPGELCENLVKHVRRAEAAEATVATQAERIAALERIGGWKEAK